MEVWGELGLKETKDRKKKSKKKLSNRKKVLISSISLVIVLVVIVTSGYFYVRSKIYRASKPIEKPVVTDIKKEETVEYKEVKGITNVLLIGADGVDFDSSDQRSDSMIIATLDSNNKKVKLTSLYRDALVHIPGYGDSKMNTAFAVGGPELVMETIKYNYDINLEKYVMINFVGFEAIIDQIGGIEIDVQKYQMHELNKYIGEATGGNDCPVTEEGLQTLNGKQALSYARIRKGVGDDYERTERQREVLFKVAEKLQKTKPIKYLGIATKMLDYIRTNIDLYECLDLAYTVFKFPSLVTEQLSIPVQELSYDEKVEGIGWVLKMDRYQNALILNDFIFNDYLPDFILNRSTEKDPSIYYEYEGFGTTDEGYYYEEDYYEPVMDKYIEEDVIEKEAPKVPEVPEAPKVPENPIIPNIPEKPSDNITPPVDENKEDVEQQEGESKPEGEIPEETTPPQVDTETE